MFDGDLMVNSSIDLDMGELWAIATNGASHLMRRATDLETSARAENGGREPHRYNPAMIEARGLRRQARTMMIPFRSAIERRTELEQMQARGMVLTGNTGFLITSDVRANCPDCERPLWQHIRVFNDSILCPFGREYWTYARAIDAQGIGVTDDDTRAFVSMIARPRAKQSTVNRD